jgi:ribose-phosphate pyrophosphokinase
MKLLTGNANLPLAQAIADYLEQPLTDMSVRRFADEEVFVEIHENVRGEDVLRDPVDRLSGQRQSDGIADLHRCAQARLGQADHCGDPLFRLCPAGSQARPAHADLGQAGRQPDQTAGANRVFSVDLHAGQIQGFFDIPTDNLYAAPVMSADIQARFSGRNLMVVSPDVGGVVRARALAKRLDNAPLAIVDKRRERPGESEVMNIIGDVAGRFCILIDDIVDSAGTLCNAAEAAVRRPVPRMSSLMSAMACCRAARLPASNGSALRELVITDSIARARRGRRCQENPRADDRAIAGEAIKRIADESSVSSLFD